MVTYNLTNATLTEWQCTGDITSSTCTGIIKVVPYNQDIIVILLSVIAFFVVVNTVYNLSKIIMR